LPAIDDGSKSLEASVILLKRMYGYGIKNFIFTPHIMEGVWENSSEGIQTKLQELKKHLKTIDFPKIKIRVAAEYMLDDNFNKLVETKDLLTLKDNKILIEISYINPPINLYETLFNIQVAGYTPVLAHPERYSFFHKKYAEYSKLKEAGCLFQLNLLSLSNYYGKSVNAIALSLLKDNLIDFVGTDTHNNKHLDFLEKVNDIKTLKLVASVLKNNTLLI